MRSPTIITIITAILAAASIPAVFAQRQPSANEIYIDKDCRRNQQLQFDKFTVFNQNEFTANGKKYSFYAGRYQDGAVLFCISEPNFNQPKVLNAEKIQRQFIDKIATDPNNKTAFIIAVREGNGPGATATNYGLDLSNPDRPKLTSLSLLQQRETLKEGESREHTFQGRAGQSITIELGSRGLDHNITLFDTNGKRIAGKTNNFQRPPESKLTVKLPSNGTYKIVVKGGDRTSKGTYTLSVNSNQL
ncbi:hypothetical protein [Microcoleus sp. EPA2]|uniref:hypothetical protein n=1 Tax=Microcoleus sp. EPA2 TaxID=2841654 RepID=UPI00312B58E0